MKNILVITARVPVPPDDGWKMRTSALIRTLSSRGNQVDLLTYSSGDADDADLEALSGVLRSVRSVRRSKAYSPWDLLRGLIFSEPFPVFNYRQDDFAQVIEAMAAQRDYDAVQVEDVVMAQYVLNLPFPLKVLDMHNVESSLMARFARQERSPAKSLYARITAAKLERYERDVTRFFDLVTVCSEQDKALLTSMGVTASMEVIPNGVWCDAYDPDQTAAQDGGIVFIGRMDYHANVSGAHFLVDEILPRLLKLCPGVRVSIVGKNPGPAIRAMEGPNVAVYADVPDVAPYLAKAAVVVVPLLVGGGTRLKILEAMAAGKAVVSTRIGAEGIEAVDGEEISLMDSPEEFAAEVARLLGDPGARMRMGAAAREMVSKRYDWDVVGGTLDRCLTSFMTDRVHDGAGERA